MSKQYEKIQTSQEIINSTLKIWVALGARLSLTGGVFDIQHYMHYEYLEHISETAEKSILLVSTDERVKQSKGKNTILSWEQRAKQLSHLPYIDLIIPKESSVNNLNMFMTYQPNTFYYSTTSGINEFNELQEKILPEYPHYINNGRITLQNLNGTLLTLYFFDANMNEFLCKNGDIAEFLDKMREQSKLYNTNKWEDPNNISGSIIKKKIKESI